MRTSAFFGAKSSDFLKFMVCPHGQGRRASADILWTRGEGSIFRDFVRTSFMAAPLLLCKVSRHINVFYIKRVGFTTWLVLNTF